MSFASYPLEGGDEYLLEDGYDDLTSHALEQDEGESSEDEEKEDARDMFERIMRMRREKADSGRNLAAPAINGQDNFGYLEHPFKKKQNHTVNIQNIKPGDIFKDCYLQKDKRKENPFKCMVLGKHITERGYEEIVLLVANNSIKNVGNDDRLIWSIPPFSLVAEGKYETSLKGPLTTKALQFFSYAYADYTGWSNDDKLKYRRSIYSQENEFSDILRQFAKGLGS